MRWKMVPIAVIAVALPAHFCLFPVGPGSPDGVDLGVDIYEPRDFSLPSTSGLQHVRRRHFRDARPKPGD